MTNIAAYIVLWIEATAAIFPTVVTRHPFASTVSAIFPHDAASAPFALKLHVLHSYPFGIGGTLLLRSFRFPIMVDAIASS